MTDRIVDLLILAEDLRAARLFMRYAQQFIHQRRIRYVICSAGSGEQFVRSEFPRKVKWQRSCAGKKRAALIVHIDADDGTVDGELRLLESALLKEGMHARGNDERIAIAVPKRNVETWIHGLCGVAVDEEYDYKRDSDGRVSSVTRSRAERIDRQLGPAARALYELTRRNAGSAPPTMPALKAAIPELRRLED